MYNRSICLQKKAGYTKHELSALCHNKNEDVQNII